MVCLDTDILIDFLRNDNYTLKKISEFKKNNIELATTTINTFELFKGAFRLKQKDAFDGLTGLLNNLKIFDFNFKASEKAAQILEKLRLNGETIDALDLMIASIAIINNELFLTRNIKHFSKISELKIKEM